MSSSSQNLNKTEIWTKSEQNR